MEMPLDITAEEFASRREQLKSQLATDGLMLLAAADHPIRNGDAEYGYRQNSNFWYLTGFDEPEAVMVIAPNRKEGEYILFCRDRNPEMEQWTGRRAGQDGAKEIYGADQAFSISKLDEMLPALMEDRDTVYLPLARGNDLQATAEKALNVVRGRVRTGIAAPQRFEDIEPLIHEMRLFKSAAEAEQMRYAGKVSAMGHTRAMEKSHSGLNEYQLEAEICHEFARMGCRDEAYSSIVGGGENACILHYIENNQLLKHGDMVLIDAGAEFRKYAGDITRTFPVDGKFSEPQRELYQIVLNAQLASIEQVKPGNTFDHPHQATLQALTSGLVELGILKGDVKELIEKEAYKPFFMHKTGHWLGIDVHDCGKYKIDGEWRKLEPGMVMTIEPGLYISPSDDVDEKYWNIGIRIEDDILVTESGYENLSADVVKSVEEIETLMGQRNK